MKCSACDRAIRKGTGRKALVVRREGIPAPGVVCARCASTGTLLVAEPAATVPPACSECRREPASLGAHCAERMSSNVRALSAANVARVKTPCPEGGEHELECSKCLAFRPGVDEPCPEGDKHTIACSKCLGEVPLAASEIALPEPTPAQLAALVAYAKENGPTWKSKLVNQDWPRAAARIGGEHSPELQQIRNTLGFRWLASFTLPEQG